MTLDTRHPTPDALRRVASGSGSTDASKHLEACAECRADIDILLALASQRPSIDPGACPDGLVLVSLHRDELPAVERAAALGHANTCSACAVALEVLACDAGAATPPAEPSTVRRASTAVAKALASLASFELPMALAFDVRGDKQESDLDDALGAAREGRLDDAVAGLRLALARGDDDPAVHFHLGACLVALGEPAEGVNHLAAAAQSRRKFAEFAWFHAQALLLAGHGDDALAELRRCARLPGPRADAARELAATVAAALAKR